MELVEPSLTYEKSFREGMAEHSVRPVPGAYFFRDDESVATYIERLRKNAQGVDLPEGRVPATTFWLVEGEEYIGHADIRHRLTPALSRLGGHIGFAIRPSRHGQGYGTQMLKLALKKAAELGVDRVLITCDTTNAASRRVIEKNGGVLWDEVVIEGRPVPTLRFWIDNRRNVCH